MLTGGLRASDRRRPLQVSLSLGKLLSNALSRVESIRLKIRFQFIPVFFLLTLTDDNNVTGSRQNAPRRDEQDGLGHEQVSPRVGEFFCFS